MTDRSTLITTLHQEVREALKERMSNIKKQQKVDFRVKAKHLSQGEQKEIINEMRKSYFEPYQQTGLMPSLVKFTDANFRDYLSEYFDVELERKLKDPARRRNLINQVVKYFLFAEMHEFFTKLKADLDKGQEVAAANTKNQILSKNQVQRTIT